MAGAEWNEIRKKLAEAERSLDRALSPPRSVSDRILRERAAQSALLTEEDVSGESIEVVVFRMANESYAVETSFVREVCPLTNLTPVPCTPALVLGVINLHARFLRGLTDEGVVILDAASVLCDSAFVVNELVER